MRRRAHRDYRGASGLAIASHWTLWRAELSGPVTRKLVGAGWGQSKRDGGGVTQMRYLDRGCTIVCIQVKWSPSTILVAHLARRQVAPLDPHSCSVCAVKPKDARRSGASSERTRKSCAAGALVCAPARSRAAADD